MSAALTRRALLALAAAPLAALALSPQASHSAKRKLDRIAGEKLPPGSTLVLTEDEINSYFRYDFAADIPKGITDPHFRLEPDRVTGTATIDFGEWRAQNGGKSGPLLGLLLRGQRPVEAVCRYTSAHGYGQADIESVSIGGVSIAGAAVTFLIQNLVQPRYPEAVVGRPAPLGYKLEQVRIEQGRAVIVAR